MFLPMIFNAPLTYSNCMGKGILQVEGHIVKLPTPKNQFSQRNKRRFHPVLHVSQSLYYWADCKTLIFKTFFLDYFDSVHNTITHVIPHITNKATNKAHRKFRICNTHSTIFLFSYIYLLCILAHDVRFIIWNRNWCT